MPEFGPRVVARARGWLVAAAIGAIGAPLHLWFLGNVWPSVYATTPAMGSLPVIVMLAMPVGLLAGAVATGIGGFIALWLGALAATIAVVSQHADNGFAAFAAALAVLVIPQATLPGYLLARAIGRVTSDRVWAMPQRIVAMWLVPSLGLLCVIGTIGVLSGVAVRSTRVPSCPPLVSNAAAVGQIVFAGSHALCVADLASRSVRLVYASPSEFDETLDSVRWSPTGETIAAIRERRPLRGSITREMVLVSADGTTVTPRATPGEFGTVESVDWAVDDDRLIVTANDRGCAACAGLYLVPVAGGDWSEVPLPADVIDVRFPSMSASADRIMVGAARSFDAVYGAADLLILEGDGRVVAWVATDADFLSPAGWSNDGEWIAFGRRFQRGTDIYLARGAGTLPGRLTTTADAAENSVSTTHPVWSPDGRSIAVSVYASNELPHAISIIPVGGGPAVLVIEGATDYDWKP